MRGILFIEPLYHQTIAGIKTMTRRSGGLEVVNEKPDNWEITGQTGEDNLLEIVDFCDCMDTQRNVYLKPRYKIDEVLFLKEPYIQGTDTEGVNHFSYKFNLKDTSPMRTSIKWKNKLFMPAEAGRIFVRITGIKCERLMDIKGQDCIAEGIETTGFISRNYNVKDKNRWFTTDSHLKDSFLSLYKFANKVKEVPNLWVWVYSYEFLPNYSYESY